MTPTRVLQLIGSSRRGGAEGVVFGLATGLAPERTHTEVGLLEPGWLADELTAAGIPPHWLTKRRTLDWSLLANLARLIRNLRPDVVHCHLGTMNLYGCLAARYSGRPAIAHVHGLPHDLDRPRRRWVQRQAWRAADRVVVVSGYLCRVLRAMGAPARKLMTIPNGVRLDQFEPKRERSHLKRALGMPETAPVIAVVSRLEVEKGVDLALDCLEHVRRRLPSASLLIAGDGSQLSALQAKARISGVNGSIRFLGHIDDIAPVLGAADVVLVPARSEGFSLAAVEAMAACRPVIAWDQHGPQEIVVDGETGRLVSAFDVPAMAEAVVDVLSDAAAARAMGRAGHARAARCYDADTMFAQFEGLYASLCEGRKVEGDDGNTGRDA